MANKRANGIYSSIYIENKQYAKLNAYEYTEHIANVEIFCFFFRKYSYLFSEKTHKILEFMVYYTLRCYDK
jgi:hypothetical protein